MDFALSPLALQLRERLLAFMDRYLLPYNAAWHAAVAAGDYPPPFVEDLKALAREEGLWNLFLPTLRDDEPGTRLSNLDYAPLAEAMGRLPWAAEVFNCQAPDTGNIELLHRFATPAQRTRWLVPLLHGQMRSAFAMSEPDVASSDPTNLQTTVRREGDRLVFAGEELEYSRPQISEVRGILFERVDAGKTAGNTGKGVLATLGIALIALLTLGLSLAG